MKHFSEGNNEQEYEGLFSKWKDKDEMTSKSKIEPLIQSFNEAYNMGIDHAIGIVAQNTINEPDRVRVVLEHVIEVLSNLKKNIQ